MASASTAAAGTTRISPQDTIKILISTDNHLGYAEKDPIRGADSFRTFQEILQAAKDHKVDFMLLAGDLFHENKPSRRTLYQTMALLRSYVMGDGQVNFQILSDQSINFPNFGQVNYEDPNYNIELPIFSIHGNHDDPTRDSGLSTTSRDNSMLNQSLAALDLLSAANLVNYFGKNDQVDAIEIFPILISKGNSKMAIYGLGNLRDERLNRMFAQQKVIFRRPKENPEQWFNVFVVHQNRTDRGPGKKNFISESFIPEFIDFVVWGHEHECRIQPQESLKNKFYISQPGSSIATSLVEGESKRKQIAILDIHQHSFRLTSVPLTTVRPFIMEEIALRDVEELDVNDPELTSQITSVLETKVNELIDKAKQQQLQEMQELQSVNNTSHNRAASEMATQPVLVRLRVEHSGFPVLHNQRFGSRFVGKVANPNDILLFFRRKKSATATSGVNSSQLTANDDLSKSKRLLGEPFRPSLVDAVTIEDILNEQLELPDKKLSFLPPANLAIALEEYVVKNIPSALEELVAQVLEDTQKKLVADNKQSKEEIWSAVEQQQERRQAEEALRKETEITAGSSSTGATNGTGGADAYGGTKVEKQPSTPTRARAGAKSKRPQLSDSDEEEFKPATKATPSQRFGTPRTSRTTSKSQTKKPFDEREEEVDDDDESAAWEEAEEEEKPKRGRGRGRAGRGRARAVATSTRQAPARAKRRRVSESDSDSDQHEVEEDDPDKEASIQFSSTQLKYRAEAAATKKRARQAFGFGLGTPFSARTDDSQQQLLKTNDEIDLCSSDSDAKQSKPKPKPKQTRQPAKRQRTIQQLFQSQQESSLPPTPQRARRQSALQAQSRLKKQRDEDETQQDTNRNENTSEDDLDSDFTQLTNVSANNTNTIASESQSQNLKRRTLPLSMLNSQESKPPLPAPRRAWGRTRR